MSLNDMGRTALVNETDDVSSSQQRGLSQLFAGLAAPTALIGCLLTLAYSANSGAWRPLALVFIGVALGATLFLTDFGFSSAYRKAAVSGDYSTFRGHALMLALGSVLMVPVIHLGTLFGHPVDGFATPLGISLIGGGLLFGIGMQMSGGCASGTLFLLGSGNLKFLLTLATFILGSTVGAAHFGFWRSLASLPPMTVFTAENWSAVLAIEVTALLCAALWLPSKSLLSRKTISGAVGLALLNFATLVVAGRPWSETFGFALWGSKAAAALGFQPATWDFWGDGSVLNVSIFRDTTSIMDVSIVLGAMLAAGLSRRFRFSFSRDWREWLSAGLGGLMMGYGARLSDGCNIGAYFSAIVSGSFSGYVWALAALVGSALGVSLRAALLHDRS